MKSQVWGGWPDLPGLAFSLRRYYPLSSWAPKLKHLICVSKLHSDFNPWRNSFTHCNIFRDLYPLCLNICSCFSTSLLICLSLSFAFHLLDMHIRWKDFLICLFNSYVYVKSILYLMVKGDWYLHCLTEVKLWNLLIASSFDKHYWHLMYTFSLGSWLYIL